MNREELPKFLNDLHQTTNSTPPDGYLGELEGEVISRWKKERKVSDRKVIHILPWAAAAAVILGLLFWNPMQTVMISDESFAALEEEWVVEHTLEEMTLVDFNDFVSEMEEDYFEFEMEDYDELDLWENLGIEGDTK